MNFRRTNGLGPFLILTFTFFIVGFMTIVNGQCQGPLKIAFLEHAGHLKNTFTTLISFCYFLGFLVCSPISGRWINRYGYKTPLLRGLSGMVAGLTVYFVSSWIADSGNNAGLQIGDALIPYGFFVFILGSFLMGSSAALVQTVILPYVSACDLPNTQPVQRVNITSAANSFGTTIAPFFVTVVLFGGIPLDQADAGQLMIPFLAVALCIALTRFVVGRLPLPDIKDTRAAQSAASGRSIWSFRHLKLGVVAVFFYVGAEVAVGQNVNLYAMELEKMGEGLSFLGSERFMLGNLHLGIPALLATLYWGGLMVGRIISGFFNTVSARVQLTAASVAATLLTLAAMLTNNLWMLVCVGLCHSVMWGCIFTLAVDKLKHYTSKASGIFMTGVFGGAVIPVLQGFFADMLGAWQWTWTIVIVCELVILYYALRGSRVQKEEIAGL